MADFCKQCSIEVFGADYGDYKGLQTEGQTKDGYRMSALCEDCGPTFVDHTGKCCGPCAKPAHDEEASRG